MMHGGGGGAVIVKVICRPSCGTRSSACGRAAPPSIGAVMSDGQMLHGRLGGANRRGLPSSPASAFSRAGRFQGAAEAL